MTSDQDDLWVSGAFALRVWGRGGAGKGRVVALGRPYAVIGRVEGADVRVDHPEVHPRHAYLHLDRRGLYAVDLATRGGTRVGPEGHHAGWLRPGEALEVAGHRVEVEDLRLDGRSLDPGPTRDDPLAEAAGPSPLARVTLYPSDAPEAPLSLGSELVFLGRSACCGVQVRGESAARTHCVLVRTEAAAYVVDLAGRGTWLNQRPVRGASPLAHGDRLTVGSAGFAVRVEPAAAALAMPAVAGLPAELIGGAGLPAEVLAAAGLPCPPPGLLEGQNQTAVLAWMLGVLQAGQARIASQQAEFQQSMVSLLREMHHDNSSLLSKHFERVDAINEELASLRDELQGRFGAPPPGPPAAPPLPPPLKIASHLPPADPVAATSWLLDRVNKLDQENRSTLKDLMGRLGVNRKSGGQEVRKSETSP